MVQAERYEDMAEDLTNVVGKIVNVQQTQNPCRNKVEFMRRVAIVPQELSLGAQCFGDGGLKRTKYV